MPTLLCVYTLMQIGRPLQKCAHTKHIIIVVGTKLCCRSKENALCALNCILLLEHLKKKKKGTWKLWCVLGGGYMFRVGIMSVTYFMNGPQHKARPSQ